VGLQDADTGEEATRITWGNYARVLATFDYCVDGVTIANVAALQWPVAAADWGDVDAVLLWSGPTLANPGNLLGSLACAVLSVPMYARARIPPAGIAVLDTTVPRPYGVGLYGTENYGTWNTMAGGSGVLALLELTFGTPAHVCQPGTWTKTQYALETAT
jgi:hypothetical protein